MHTAAAWSYQFTPLGDKQMAAEKCAASSSSASHPRTSPCSNCSSPLQPDAKFCGQCGTPVKTCVTCKEVLALGAKFCSLCGTPVPQSTASSATGQPRDRKRKAPSTSSSSSSDHRKEQTPVSRARGHRMVGDISSKVSRPWKIQQES